MYFFRYGAVRGPKLPTCRHNSKALQCASLTNIVVVKFHDNFYSRVDKQSQDNFILKHIEINKVNRRRPSTQTRSGKELSFKYFIRNNATKEIVPVCRTTFINALGITKHRVQGVGRRFFTTGKFTSERRGGDRKSRTFEDKKNAVISFIKSFKAIESHYCRNRNQRVYLSSELSIRKMWRIYDQQTTPSHIKVKETYFRKIFTTFFNIGFGSPRTDVCSKCLELDEKIKTEKNEQHKQKLMVQKRLHKLRSKAFFELLREKRANLLTFTFDCQKNFALPRLPDQATYYSRQFYLYNFTIVQGTSKDPLKGNTYIYTWGEHELPKGSNEIASCLYHRLNNTDFSGISVIRCMADGCGGQNKNSVVISMLSRWLANEAPQNVKKIECIFPVPGHSFIPPDRVFARIEKKIKTKEILSEPKDFYEILQEHGKVFHLGVDIADFDWKTYANNIIKPPAQWHFQFAPTKRFFLFKKENHCIHLQGEFAYRSETGKPLGICKKGKHLSRINPQPVKIGKKLNPLKVRDVNKLLEKHYGEDWRNLGSLEFYKTIIDNGEVGENDDNPDDLVCEAMPEEVDIRI